MSTKPGLPLLALAVGAFGIGTTEFAPMGMLPVIAGSLHISIPTAGMLITAYAVGVMLGAPLMVLGTSRVPRHLLLCGLMGIFTVGNLLAAIAPSYALLMLARVVTSLAHGAFFGVGAIVAASLVPPARRSSAVATMFMGLTVATIGGSPMVTWIGQQVGWRIAFAGISGLGVLAMVSLWFALPKIPAGEPPDLAHELGVLRRPAVLLALATTVLGAGAMFTVMTYVAPILQHMMGASPSFVTAMLVLIGIGFTVGNGLGGRFADRSLEGSLLFFLGLLTLLLVLFTVTLHTPVAAAISIFLWGVATFAVVPPLQTRVMDAASDAPSLASSVNIGAFNLGNALGAVVGGGVLDAGLGYPWISVAGGALSLLGIVLVLIGQRIKPFEAAVAD
ncbi:MFS transporter [Frateuria aurantia]